MEEPKVWRAFAVAVPTIALIITALFAVSFAVSALVGLPLTLGLPVFARVVGGVMVVAGLAVGAWIFRYRTPVDMLVSTYITFRKLFRGLQSPNRLAGMSRLS